MHKVYIYSSIVCPTTEAMHLGIPYEVETQEAGSETLYTFYLNSQEEKETFQEKMSHWL